MKISFKVPSDGKRHRYCQDCFSEKVEDVKIDNKTVYKCNHCGSLRDRLIDLDPGIKWWVDPKTKELWHESAGVFINYKGKEILLMERTIYPYGFTIPAGHLDASEIPVIGAVRELFEETGIKAASLNLFTQEDLPKDRCRRGANIHRWHLYTYKTNRKEAITPDPGEGKNPVWLTIKEALSLELTPPTRYFLEKYNNKLLT